MVFDLKDALLSAIREGREEAEQSREMPPQIVKALKDTQLTSMAVAATHGGAGATLAEMAEVLEAIAYEDASASWVLWNATLVGFYVRFMPAALRELLFRPGHSLFCH